MMAPSFSSGYWDGPAPQPGDLILWGREWFRIKGVARGAGLGQWTMDTVPLGAYYCFDPTSRCRVFAWHGGGR